ncbi:Butyrophilin subfamily 2 member A3 [Pteropus alecto]|uniref:Butyrophilin subfamily 2 member A3 n=1 Tax=Pteropus alecto TaxID=9402 RepID=L5L0T5_PTEAL|nr:Butyrophilin subfamily 2 member A3 [Pteropus alecto]
MLGADTTLPCCVSPDMSVENMELWWFRCQFSDAVYMYQDGMEQMRKQLVDFKGRAVCPSQAGQGLIVKISSCLIPLPHPRHPKDEVAEVPSIFSASYGWLSPTLIPGVLLHEEPLLRKKAVQTISTPGFGSPVPEPFFPKTSPWKLAFAVTFPILEIFVGAIVFLAWKEQQEKKKAQEAKKEKEKESKAKSKT